MVLTVNFGSYRDALLGRRTIFGTPFASVKVLSSPNMTFFILQLSNVDYFWQKLSLFFFIAAVSMGFLTARRPGRPKSFWNR